MRLEEIVIKTANAHSFEDADADNYGNITFDSLSCEIPDEYVIDSTDCNDSDPNIYPGAVELLNGLDDNCNGMTDEGLSIFESSQSSLYLYPNPTKYFITLSSSFAANTIAPVSIDIYNVRDELIYSFGDIEIPFTLNTSIIPPGMYIIRINNQQEMLYFIKIE